MASDQSLVDYATDQIKSAGRVSSRKMFGEFAIYCDDRVVALVCDNQLYLKPTAGGRRFIGVVTEAPPYPGSKPHFLLTDRLDDREWLTELVVITAREVPVPKTKRSAARSARTAVKTSSKAKSPAKRKRKT